MKTKLFITGLAIMAFATLTNAQNTQPVQSNQVVTGLGPEAVDANNNGICDNFENGTSNIQTGKRNFRFRNAIQAQSQLAQPDSGMRPVRPGRGLGMGPGRGRGMGPGRGMGRGRFYVDANKNGVCDIYESSSK